MVGKSVTEAVEGPQPPPEILAGLEISMADGKEKGMKKYGLQLRVQPQQKKQPTKSPVPTPLAFNDDDDDNVERDIMRQAYKNKTHKDIEEQHKRALEEDPSVFDYDGVYDKMKEKQVRPIQQDRQDRKPRYIQTLMDKAKQREREHEIIYERKLAKERSQDEHLYADKDKFVTSAYKKKLAEQAKWLEEERLRDMREEKEDVTKKTDLSDFYFNLAKNVAFGAGDADSRKTGKQPEEVVVQQPVQVSPPATNTHLESSRTVKSHQDGTAMSVSPKGKSEREYTTPISDTSAQDQMTNEPSISNQPRLDEQNKSEDAVVAAKDHHKRSEDAVAAAKERFLARKKSKVL
ncbi:Nuclear speckle splicing regulatory protein 1 [Sesamum alatum]|uniref:Nuclear speckle splicing regulatory protein 1 n=1 Tax=Sesamum alatum TaxID=300844 RepID=A0AAE2CZU3_9LAMI|nr:Nuclear speckle splicing regulatory protein 1 [Sesamum alatum]